MDYTADGDFVTCERAMSLGDGEAHQLLGLDHERLGDGNDSGDLGHFFAEVAFDAHLQGHGAAGAAVAGAVEANLDDAVAGDVNEFDIAAVGLYSGADQVDHALDFFLHRRGLWGGNSHRYLSYGPYRQAQL